MKTFFCSMGIVMALILTATTVSGAESDMNATAKQNDELLIRSVVEKYIAGTYEADISKLRNTFSESATMNGYLGDQLVESTPESFYQDLSSKPSLKDSGANYDGKIEQISITGNVASVLLRETGFGPFNFTNYFHLLKKDGEWLITTEVDPGSETVA